MKYLIKYQMRNECASCGAEFQNNQRYYETIGNFCPNCNRKINLKFKWRNGKTMIKRIENRIYKAEKEGKATIKMGILTFTFNEAREKIKDEGVAIEDIAKILWRGWGIDIKQEDKNSKKFFAMLDVL